MQIKTPPRSGFTLVEIMIVVAIIGLLAAIAIPNLVKARLKSQANACINNLRQLDGAKQQWAVETKAAPAAAGPDTTTLAKYLNHGTASSLPVCPADSANGFATSYTIGDLVTLPACLIDTVNHVMPN